MDIAVAQDESLVLRHDGAGVATLALNRPDKANALSQAMLSALERALLDADADPAVRVIVLAASGRIFCAGHDLAELRGHTDPAWHAALFAQCSAVMLLIRRMAKPVIARVQGAAVAAGCQLVATCDLAYAAEGARFSVSGIDLGLFCSTPSVALSRAVPEKQAMEMLLTGGSITAGRAAEIGLITRAVPADRLHGAVDEAAGTIAGKLPAAVALGKALFHRQSGLDLAQAYAMAAEAMAANMEFAETRAGIDGFLARARHP